MIHGYRFTSLKRIGCVIGLLCLASPSDAASFGMNFGSGRQGWGPYFVNPANGASAHGYAGHPSAFGVVAADWYEPGSAPGTAYLPGAPSSVNFKPASMGAGSVNIAYQSYDGPPNAPGTGYTWSAFGFAHANQYETVDVSPADGQPDVQANGQYVLGPLKPENGQPQSGEHAVLAGFMFATADGEYGNPWPAQDIVVNLTGLQSIASSYKVKLYASAQNGDPNNLVGGVHAFTPATVSDNASNTETVSFAIMDDHPNYWSPSESFEVDADPTTFNTFKSVAGVGTGTTSYTGDSLTIRLSGANEYFNDNLDFTRTTLAAIVIEYNSIAPPAHAGDFDGDGDVDGADFVAWQTNFPKATGATLAQGDADADGDVDGADFVVWQTNFPFTPAPGASPVPEPSAIFLGVCGVLGFIGLRRRKLAA